MTKIKRGYRPIKIPKYSRVSVKGNRHNVSKHKRQIKNIHARRVILPIHERAFTEGEKREGFKKNITINMRERIAQPTDSSSKLIRELNAKHPLLVGFSVHVPKNYNKYGVTIGKYEKDLEKASLSEIRNVEIVPIMAVSRRELEDFNRLEKVKTEGEDILAEIDARKEEELFADWRTDPKVSVLINSDLKGERTSEIGLIDLEKARPGDAVTVSNKLVLKQKVDRTGGFSGKDKDKAKRFQENAQAIEYFARMKEYEIIHKAYLQSRDGNERARYQNILYGDDKGKIRNSDDLALEPYLKTNYPHVLHVLQNRGLEIQGSDEHFKRTDKGKLDFTQEGWQKDSRPSKDFMFNKAGTLRRINKNKVLAELRILDKENRQIAVEGRLDQLKGKTTYHTTSFTLEPVARDLTVQEGDRRTSEKSGAAFKDVIFQDLGKLRTIRRWQEGQDTDDKTKTQQWAIFVHDGINRAIENRPPNEAQELHKLKTLKMNPMVMEKSDLHFIESRLGVVFPDKPKTDEITVDFVKDQMVIPVEKPAREKLAPREVRFEEIHEPATTVREFTIPDVPTFEAEPPTIERPREPVPELPRPSQIETTPAEPVLRGKPSQFVRTVTTAEQQAALVRGDFEAFPATTMRERPSKHRRRRR